MLLIEVQLWFYFFSFLIGDAREESRVSYMLDKCSPTELHP